MSDLPDSDPDRSAPVTLREQVRQALEDYFQHLDGHAPANLYKLVLQEIEPPLLETVMRYADNRQTRAAEVLGINRSTLRKKLKQYGLE